MTEMTLKTSRFGDIQVEESRVVGFSSPILGFEGFSRYVVLDHAPESPFQWLQSIEDADLAFVVTNPSLFGITYELTLDSKTVEQLEIKGLEDAVVLTIVNIPPEDPARMTANLVAPIIINQKTMKGMQIVLNETLYSTKTRLIPDEVLEQASSQTPSGTGE